MTQWSDELEGRMSAMEKKVEAMEGGTKCEKEIRTAEIRGVGFRYDPKTYAPFNIAQEHAPTERWWVFEEKELKKIVEFWRSCGADV